MLDPTRIQRAYQTVRDELLAERTPAGHWVGELSSSALSTATAVSALAMVRKTGPATKGTMQPLDALILCGLGYLAKSQNDDGGWGDTDKSLSNIATTMLVRAAFHLAGAADAHPEILARAERYLDAQGGIPALHRRYGKDKTFAAPILTNCALAGLAPWEEVASLPFELACLPHWMLGILRLPVVSYAIPALVAIGQARYVHRKPWNPLARLLRRLAQAKSLEVASRMQPDSGGFLEATPLTSFVVMSLASIGQAEHAIVRRGVEFLVASARKDGSWPIDTNLATWGTTLAVNALASAGEDVAQLGCLDWLLACQHGQVHPFTKAAPYGWGWTDLSGAVPDADDTPGALLALAALRGRSSEEAVQRIDRAAKNGIGWLLGLQNADGGWPTFCRGWGALPFDRSGVDLTAHALRALDLWRHLLVQKESHAASSFARRLDRPIHGGLRYLARHQGSDGRWVPLWFGNQHEPREENPVYGTAKVLLAYRDLKLLDQPPARRAIAWLLGRQGKDGGWGGGPSGSSVEETALAAEALISCGVTSPEDAAVDRAVAWLVEAVETGRVEQPSPIGLYFAKLWYYERLYPLVFTVSALGHAVSCGPGW
jgi:squalene-hopene/tetraprenyl-beta-curcumene cyclase